MYVDRIRGMILKIFIGALFNNTNHYRKNISLILQICGYWPYHKLLNEKKSILLSKNRK